MRGCVVRNFPILRIMENQDTTGDRNMVRPAIFTPLEIAFTELPMATDPRVPVPNDAP